MKQRIKTFLNYSWSLFKRHKVKFSVLIVGLLLGGRVLANMGDAPTVIEQKPKTVEVLSLSDIVSDGASIPVVGNLQANQQVDIRPQAAGPVSAVWVKVGQYVGVGQVLAEISHRDLDASVAQASAGLQSALAQLAKTKNGSRPEDLISAEQNLIAAQQQLADMLRGGRPEEVAQAQNGVQAAETALDEANTNFVRTEEQNALTLRQTLENALLTISSAQLSVDKILLEDLAILFNKNSGDALMPVFEDIVLQSQTDNMRDDAGVRLRTWKQSTAILSATSTEAVKQALVYAETELSYQRSFLDLTNTTLQEAIGTPSYTDTQISTAKATVNAARATVKAQLNAVTAARQGIDSVAIANQRNLDAARSRIDSAATQVKNAKEALQIVMQGPSTEQIAAQEARVKQAEQQLNIAKNGARPEDIHLQEALVAQARASVALAAAQREKAIIRAPISGTVTYIPIKLGDLISSSSIAVSLANPSVLEVEVFVSESERRFLEVGNSAFVNDTVKAGIREIAPALDPVNSKIKVVITLLEPAPQLTLGETVRVTLTKIAPEASVIRLPLSAVKFTTTGVEVFIVNDQSQIEALSVEAGTVSANTIEILTKLETDWKLVKDVRGLKAGQTVNVK